MLGGIREICESLDGPHMAPVVVFSALILSSRVPIYVLHPVENICHSKSYCPIF